MSKSDVEFLNHIKKECDYLLKFSKNLSEEDFYKDETLQRAFTRCLEIIGEASKRVDLEFRSKYPLIPWKEMAGMRDKIIHYYEGVDYSIVWITIVNKIPELHFQIAKIINEHDT
ncbi:MAG: DUF86 domain-containing protein [Flavobacterium sp.]|nr:DUF86 domain-containing protein [Flavobacterium sp.]